MSTKHQNHQLPSGFYSYPLSISSEPKNFSLTSPPSFAGSSELISPIQMAPISLSNTITTYPLATPSSPRAISPFQIRQERPIVVQKQIQLVEDTSKIVQLQDQLKLIAEQNKYFASQLAEFRNKPPIIQEKIQFIEDTSKIDRLNRQFDELLYEMSNVHKKQLNKEEENTILKDHLAQLGNLHSMSESENGILRATIKEINEELSCLRSSNKVLTQQNQISSQQIEDLQGSIRQYLHQIQKKSTVIEEKGKKICGMEKQLKEMKELKFNLSMMENTSRMRENQCNELENIKNILAQEGVAKEEQIQDLISKLQDQSETAECLQESIRSLQETLGRSEDLVYNQSNVIKLQIVEISDFQSKNEKLTALVENFEFQVRQLEQQVEHLQKLIDESNMQKDEMQLEIEHLQSYEERLALLHKEIEEEKIFSIMKIKENDRLLHIISKLELQVKRFNQGPPDSEGQKILTREETNKRSKLAISQADSLKFSKNSVIEMCDNVLKNSIGSCYTPKKRQSSPTDCK